jgi:DNA-directed RNA polymerase subunit N (RpoN/RPB10)
MLPKLSSWTEFSKNKMKKEMMEKRILSKLTIKKVCTSMVTCISSSTKSEKQGKYQILMKCSLKNNIKTLRQKNGRIRHFWLGKKKRPNKKKNPKMSLKLKEKKRNYLMSNLIISRACSRQSERKIKQQESPCSLKRSNHATLNL